MLLSLMIVCAVGAILLFALGAFDELRDAWTHPDHKAAEDDLHHPKPKYEAGAPPRSPGGRTGGEGRH